MSRDGMTEKLVEVLIARPFYVVSLTGWVAWTTAQILTTPPWRLFR